MLIEDTSLTNPGLPGKNFILHLYPWILDKVDATPVTALVDLNG
jgi:hypothetical protein